VAAARTCAKSDFPARLDLVPLLEKVIILRHAYRGRRISLRLSARWKLHVWGEGFELGAPGSPRLKDLGPENTP